MNTSNLKEMLVIEQKPVGGASIPTVSARKLHEALGVGRRFTTWIQARIEKYGFQEGKHFCRLETLSLPKSGSAKSRQQTLTEYFISIPMAKELCMVEENDVGRAVRQYFIECEEQLQKVSLSLKDSLLLGVIRAQEDLDRALALNAYEVQYVVPLENKVQELEPKAEFYDDCVDAEGLLKLKEAAKILGTGRNRLCQFLRDHKVFMRNSTEPYQRFVESGWFVVKVITINGFNHSVTLITGKGLTKIKSLFEKEPIYD